MNGIVVIDKPQGMTSHDVVSVLRRKTGEKRVGHTGTLDPMATGVLPVFIGKATRLIEYAGRPGDPEAKVYRVVMKMGLCTDTQDIWGTPIAFSGEGDVVLPGEGGVFIPDEEEIKRVLKGFEGPGRQRPPMYSAVKVGGRKLYEYARKGVEIDEADVKEREIYIKHIIVNDVDIAAGEVRFDVHCSKGVYIRTLCADAGRLLGCGAVMSGLIRLKSDGFSIEDAVSLDSLEGEGCPAPATTAAGPLAAPPVDMDGSPTTTAAGPPALLPMDAPLSWMPRAELSSEGAVAFARGQKAEYTRVAAFGDSPFGGAGEGKNPVCVYSPEGFIGIGNISENGLINPEKVII